MPFPIEICSKHHYETGIFQSIRTQFPDLYILYNDILNDDTPSGQTHSHNSMYSAILNECNWSMCLALHYNSLCKIILVHAGNYIIFIGQVVKYKGRFAVKAKVQLIRSVIYHSLMSCWWAMSFKVLWNMTFYILHQGHSQRSVWSSFGQAFSQASSALMTPNTST